MCMRRSASHETTAHKITNAVSARRHKTRGQRSRSALNARKNTPSLKNGRETCKICSYERLEEEKNKQKKRGCTSSASVQIHSNTFCHITYYIYLCVVPIPTPHLQQSSRHKRHALLSYLSSALTFEDRPRGSITSAAASSSAVQLHPVRGVLRYENSMEI